MSKHEKPALGLDGTFTLLLSTVIIVCSLGITYLLSWYRVYRLARTTPTQCKTCEIIVVHGMKLTNNKINRDFTSRLDRASKIHQAHQAYILILGGITGKNTISEAEAGKHYLTAKGINPEFIIMESNSRHTLENLKEARQLITKMGIKKSSLLSNRYHLARIFALATGMKMKITLIAAEDNCILSITNLIRLSLEAVYLHWYYTGKYWSYASRNKHSIDRIS